MSENGRPTWGAQMLDRFADWVLRARVFVILVTLAALFAFGSYFMRIESDNSYYIWYHDDNPILVAYQDFIDQFEGDEYFAVVLSHPELFTPTRLEFIGDLEKAIKTDPAIHETLSIISIEHFESEDDTLIVRPLIDEIPTDPKALAALREKATSDPFYRNLIISANGDTALVTANLPQMNMASKTDTVSRLVEIIGREVARFNGQPYVQTWPPAWLGTLQSIFDPVSLGYFSRISNHFRDSRPDYWYKLKDGTELVLTGQPVLDIEFNRLSLHDGEIFFPVVLLVTGLVMFLLFRRPAAVAYPFLVVISAMVITLGFYVLRGNTLNMITTILPALFMAMGVADSVHIFSHYNQEIALGRDQRTAVHQTIVQMFRPCFFTAFTTSIGFSSFAFSENAPVQTLGIYAAIGITLAFLLSIITVPAILSFLPAPKEKAIKKIGEGKVGKFLIWNGPFLRRNANAILVGWLLIGAVGLGGMLFLKIETQAILFLKESNPVRQSFDYLEERISGIASFEIMIEGPSGTFKEPSILKKIEEIQEEMEDGNLPKSISVVDYIKGLNKIVLSEGPDEYAANDRIPDSREGVAQLLLFMEASGGEEIFRYVDDDFSRTRISGRARFVSSEEGARNIERLESFMADLFADSPGITAQVTGLVKLFVTMDESLVQTQLRSFGLAFTLIAICMVLLMRSVKMGILSMIPNLIPIAMTMGLMGYAGIRLDVATTMIASIAISIAVDDTIHYLTRFKREFEKNRSYSEAVDRSMTGVGRAILYTSLILFAGFGVLIMGSFIPTQYFGAFAALTMLFALLGDLILLPVLMLLLKPFGPEG